MQRKQNKKKRSEFASMVTMYRGKTSNVPTGLQEGLVNSSTTSNDTDGRSCISRNSLLGS